MKRRYLAVWMLLLVSMTAGTVQAQERERDAERRVEQAERKLEEAQRQLERVLAQLRENQTREASRELERAIAQLRAAERELRRGERGYVWTRSGDDVGVFAFPEGANVALFGTGRPRIGVLVQTERNAETDSIGARLAAVTPGGAADEAGLESDDVIVLANGVSLARRGRSGENPGEKLIGIVRKLDEGDTLLVTYRRGDDSRTATVIPRTTGLGNAFAYAWGDSLQRMEITVPRLRMHVEPGAVLAPRVERLELGDAAHIFSRIAIGGWYDIELVTLNDDLGGYFGTDEGLLVIRAPRDGSLNLKSGDVILEIDGREPTSPSHAMRILRSYDEGETIRMEIMRDKRRETITATLPGKDSDWP